MKKTTKASTQYTIDLDLKTMIFFLMLALATAVVVFYLGILFGKASRDPNQANVSTIETTPSNRSEEKVITEKDLEIYSIRTEEDTFSDLKKDSASVLKKADKMLETSPSSSESSSAPGDAVQTSASSSSEPESGPQTWPEQSPQDDLPKNTYTVQVFATKDRDKAERIVRLLRQQQFDAYLARATIENQTIFRVRVGRKSRAEIEKTNEDLQKVIGGMGMKSRVLRIN